MRQFYETYKDFPDLLALLSELSWTNNLAILSKYNTISQNFLKLI